MHDTIKGWYLYFGTAMTREGQGATTGVRGGGEKTPLSAVRPCRMGVSPSEALNTSGSLYLIISYLLQVECGNLEFQVGWLR